MRRLGPKGEGRLGCILWLAVAGMVAMIAIKAVPVKLTDVEFGDYLEEQAQFSGRSSGDTIRKRVLKKAKELGIPLQAKALKVEKSNSRVKIACSYTVTLDFGFYEYNWVMSHAIDRPVFIV